MPHNPEGWLVTVARNRQRDTWKSAAARTRSPWDESRDGASGPHSPLDEIDPDAIGDRRLELLFVCAHPAIDPAVRVPLMLQVVLGFEAAQIAAAFALPPATVAQRLVRAKRRIRDARIPFGVPSGTMRAERLPAVLEAVYGCFAIARNDADETPHDTPESMAGEGLHLAVTLAVLLENEPEAWSLAALIALSLSRATARQGRFVPLTNQDPGLWDADLIAEGETFLRRAATVTVGAPGRIQLEAAMQAVHAARRHTGEVDWPALAQLSAALVSIAPTLGARVAQAAITGQLSGPRAGLAALAGINPPPSGFQPYLAVRAELLAKAGDPDAAAAFTAAANAATGPVAEYLQARAAVLRNLPSPVHPDS